MPSKQDLERSNIIALAVLCGQVADDPSRYTKEAADKASELKKEWVLLVSRETPRPPSAKEYEQIQADKRALQKRMAEFLADIL